MDSLFWKQQSWIIIIINNGQNLKIWKRKETETLLDLVENCFLVNQW